MTEILGILGLQGWGKTALTTAFGYLAFLNGFKIFSNYPLSFDYTPIETLKEAKNVRNGYLLFDEFWRWVHARTSQSNINKEMMGICLLNRKRNVSIIYNTQLPRTIDVILRDVTNYRYLPHMEYHNDGERYVHYIMRDLLDRESDEMFFNMPIKDLGKLFNTRYEVKDLGSNKSFLEIGKEIEKKCCNAINKMKGFKATSFKNSGIGTAFKGDLLIHTPKGNYLGDVKSTGLSGFISYCDSEHKINIETNKMIKNAKTWGFKPCLLFPKINKEGNYLNFPNNWFVYEINNNSYLLDNKGHRLRYNKLQLKSKILKNWVICT
jgi:hypothetical protein